MFPVSVSLVSYFRFRAYKTRSIVNNVSRALEKKEILMLWSKEIDMINNTDIYDTYKDLFEKTGEKLLQGIDSTYCLKVQVQGKRQMVQNLVFISKGIIPEFLYFLD